MRPPARRPRPPVDDTSGAALVIVGTLASLLSVGTLVIALTLGSIATARFFVRSDAAPGRASTGPEDAGDVRRGTPETAAAPRR
jgi:hypothetical protein